MEKRFIEPLDTAVLTTRFVFEGLQPILTMFHHEDDGMWEFIGDDACEDDSNYLIVSLEEMMQLDESIAAMADLPPGKAASRTGRHQPWMIRDI